MSVDIFTTVYYRYYHLHLQSVCGLHHDTYGMSCMSPLPQGIDTDTSSIYVLWASIFSGNT